MSLDDELKKLAIDFAEDAYNQMYRAVNDPAAKIEGEILNIYAELQDWHWFDVFPLDHEQAHDIYIKMIAVQKYKHLLWRKNHPPKRKLSKWEIVTGQKLKK